MFDTPINTSDQSLERVLAAGLPVLLVFTSAGMPPQFEQSLADLAQSEAGKLLVVKIRLDENPAAASRYQVSRAPALVALRSGQVLSQTQEPAIQDLQQHASFLLGKGPRPAQPSQAPRQPSYPASPLAVSDNTFDEQVLRSPTPVLVDFWAPWCGPCRMTDPIVEKLAREMSGRVRVAKVNVDENPAIAQRYGIQSIPTMMVIKNGQIADRWMGALPEPALRSRLAASL